MFEDRPDIIAAIEAAEGLPRPYNPDITDGLAWRFNIIKEIETVPLADDTLTAAERRHVVKSSWKQIQRMAHAHAVRTGTPQVDKLLIHYAARRTEATDYLMRLLSDT